MVYGQKFYQNNRNNDFTDWRPEVETSDYFLASNHGRTQKNGFLTMVKQEKLNPIGYKFRFTHLNRFCLVRRKKKSS